MLRMRAVAVILALLSPAVFGLGLGSLKTKSALNEPFLGRIEIVDANAQDFDAMTARLADLAQFQRAGVAREAVLLNLRFEVVSSESGVDYLKITTKEPVREPFLNFLLELNWAKGRLVREYTVLLDPPLYDRNKVNRPSIASPSAAPQKLTAPASSTATPAATSPAAPSAASDTIGPVQARDTAWGLALTHRPDSSISVQRMMLALLRANPAAFANSNVNVLRRGAILRMPTASEIQGISQTEALAEIKRQHEVWEGYRQASAKHVEEAPLSAPALPATTPPPATARESSSTPPATPKPDAHLELAAPETKTPSTTAAESPNRSAVAGGATEAGSKTGTDTSALTNEALDAKTRESADLQSKLTEAEQIIDLLQRQVKIKDDELAKLQSKVSTPPPPAATPSNPAASNPTPTPATVPSSATDDGFLSRLMGFIPAQIRDAVPGGAMTILGILASLLILVAFGVVRAAGSGGKAIVASAPKAATVAAVAAATAAAAAKSGPAAHDQMLSTAQHLPAYDPSGDQEQFMRTMEASADQLAGTPQEDPLEEVNVYLAYERFDQAEELVKQVITEYPNEPKYKLRLLEIYYSANNKRAYENAARELREAVGEQSPLWESAVAMWNEMSPGRALFAPGADVEPETSVAVAGAKSFVDITSATAATTLTLAPGGDPLASTVVTATDDIDSGGLDFDLSETTAQVTPTPSVLDITAGEGPDGILDLTSTADDAGLSQLLDARSTLASTHGSTGDVFDISGGLPDTLALDQDGATHDIDLLDVTDAGDGLSLGEVGLLDVTSPRSERTISTDAAEAITVNALDNRGDLDEFDLGDTVAPAAHGGTGGDELDFDIAALERSVHQATSSDLDDFDLTLDSDLDASSADAAKSDLELSLNSLSQFDLDDASDADASSGTGESDVEFDLALQDTTDFENLAINDTLEIPKSVIASRGMQAVDTPSESLEDLTRSMEASIAGLSLKDIHGDDSILDLALEPDSDSIDLDFGLDDGMGLNELDTLALDPGELRKAAGTISERTVSLSRDGIENDLHATMDETDTKLNLAKAYIELGDHDGARSILNEVVADGQTEQQDEARKLLSQLT